MGIVVWVVGNGIPGRASQAMTPVKAAGRPLVTQGDALTRGAQVARLLVPEHGSLHIQADSLPGVDVRGMSRPLWDVGCTDDTGVLRLRLQIDGATGDIALVCKPASPQKSLAANPLSRADIAEAARRWVKAVEPFGPSTPLLATKLWAATKKGWLVRFDGPGKRAFALIDGHTGAMIYMTSSRTVYRQTYADGSPRSVGAG